MTINQESIVNACNCSVANMPTFWETYQTLIVGIIGFGGVIITMIVNAYVDRLRDNRSRQKESRSLRKALVAELSSNLASINNRIEQFDESDTQHHALMRIKIFDSIYKENTSRIGVLSEEEITSTIQAYALLIELPYRVRILIGSDRVNNLDSSELSVPPEHLENVSKIHKAFAPEIEKAIAMIQAKL